MFIIERKKYRIPSTMSSKFPLDRMNKGDSFVAPVAFRNNIRARAADKNIRIAIRRLPSGNVRVWKV